MNYNIVRGFLLASIMLCGAVQKSFCASSACDIDQVMEQEIDCLMTKKIQLEMTDLREQLTTLIAEAKAAADENEAKKISVCMRIKAFLDTAWNDREYGLRHVITTDPLLYGFNVIVFLHGLREVCSGMTTPLELMGRLVATTAVGFGAHTFAHYLCKSIGLQTCDYYSNK